MKLTRKLVPAFAMLLVSALMLTTASFAWFSTNDDVSANGMSVKATTAENLVISANGTSFGTSPVALTDSATANLKPVSINCGTSEKIGVDATFYAVKESSLSTIDYASGAYNAETTLFEAAAAAGYYETFTVQVKVDGEAGTQFDKIYVENITVTRTGGEATTLNISKAIRVAVTDGTTTYIYAPLGGSYTEGKSIDAIDGSGKATAAAQTLGTLTDASNFGAVTTTAKTFTIYVWYEGQDPNCISANAVSVEDLAVSVFFKAADNALG